MSKLVSGMIVKYTGKLDPMEFDECRYGIVHADKVTFGDSHEVDLSVVRSSPDYMNFTEHIVNVMAEKDERITALEHELALVRSLLPDGPTGLVGDPS